MDIIKVHVVRTNNGYCATITIPNSVVESSGLKDRGGMIYATSLNDVKNKAEIAVKGLKEFIITMTYEWAVVHWHYNLD